MLPPPVRPPNLHTTVPRRGALHPPLPVRGGGAGTEWATRPWRHEMRSQRGKRSPLTSYVQAARDATP